MPNQSFTGVGWHTFNVPKNVTRVTVTLTGGGSRGGSGRQSGRVIGDILVKDDWVLYCFVGEGGHPSSGSNGGSGGSGGGARGGDGHQGFAGGDGGGGATYIRVNSRTGSLKVVAGGGGGESGDGGNGGNGGGSNGQDGHRGTSGTAPTGIATGGTQNQGGNGGTSSAGADYHGNDAENAVLGVAGVGGVSTTRSHGGGGGGGGYHSGGGGTASSAGYAPGGGGGGGSNYTGGLTNIKANSVGVGGFDDGSINLVWVQPPPANQPPTPPSEVKLNGVDVTDEMHTKIVSHGTLSAKVNDPDQPKGNEDTVRLVVRWSAHESFANYKQNVSEQGKPYAKAGTRVAVPIDGLVANTRYWVRLYGQDNLDKMSASYSGFSFWTNQSSPPDHLTLNGGGSGVTIQTVDSATFAWQFNDPDAGDKQQGFQLRYRTTASSASVPGQWITTDKPNTADNMNPSIGPPAVSHNQWVYDPGTFKGNQFYEWQVRTKDLQGMWSEWSLTSKFFAASTTSPPILLSPLGEISVDVTKDVAFKWKFIDPDPADDQIKADIQWRVIDPSIPLEDQKNVPTLVLGDATTPGSSKTWVIHPGPFQPGYEYQWQVRTYDHLGNVSDWSNFGRFWGIGTPGSASGVDPIPEFTEPQGSLGCGEYRVFIYQQGGRHLIGEIHSIEVMQFNRIRDDISTCTLSTNGLGDQDCCDFYASIRSWMHEIVVFRSGVRVWEGPITRITYTTTDVQFEARDVMVYVYRRILRQGYNDAYRITERNNKGQVVSHEGVYEVVSRAQNIIANALAPHDPNVLPYLTTITSAHDAKESRNIPAMSTTAWEQVDDLAATAGLDYTVIGRRILLWDTHTPIGRLPTMTDGDFSDSPIVSEYGMQTATYMAVTNGSGVAGAVEADNPSRPHGTPPFYPYGPIEMLASSYSETAGASTETLTQQGLSDLVAGLKEQARRNLSGRFPTPLIVRVPDNSSLSPECAIGFQQLIPGVWIPLRASGTCRVVTQWQKLDSVTIDVSDTGEKVQVVLSPAPNNGQDPDADQAAIDDAG